MNATPSALGSDHSRNSLKAILGGLLAARHPLGLGRWIFSYLTRSVPPLPASTQPAVRPAVAWPSRGQREKPLVWMTTTNLNADGAPLSQFELATGLAGPDLDVRIIAAADGPLRSRYEQQRIPISIVRELGCDLSVPTWYEADVEQLASMLRQDLPDLVIASTLDSFPVVDAARIAGIPSIWNIRESEPWRSRLAGLHPLVAARTLACFGYPEAVIFVARASQAAWSAFTPPERSHVIYNAPHPSLLLATMADVPAGPASPEGKTLIACVGTLCERKGQIDLARALSALPVDVLARLKVAFIGRDEGDYQSKVERALAPAAATASVFPGPVANGAAVISSAGMLVHTARSEAFPRVFLEAAARGTPIVATNVDGAPERLVDGKSALLYTPGDIPALARAVRRLLDDAELRETLKAGARDALVAHYTFADMLAAYRAHIDTALALNR